MTWKEQDKWIEGQILKLLPNHWKIERCGWAVGQMTIIVVDLSCGDQKVRIPFSRQELETTGVDIHQLIRDRLSSYGVGGLVQ